MLYALCTVFLILVSTSTVAPHGPDCVCPENSAEWTVYPDSARGAPDFFFERSIQIREIIICDGALHLFFHATQCNEKRNVCLVIAEPTYAEYLMRIPSDSVMTDKDFDKLEGSVQWGKAVFTERMNQLKEFLQNRLGENQGVTFKTGWLRYPPTIWPGQPLLLRYRGRMIELVGSLNVYFER